MCFSKNVCNYTEEGRKKIHSLQKAIDPLMLQHLMRNPIRGQSAELNDNRISLYIAQRGKCALTGQPLEMHNMEVHHIVSRHAGGSDKYENLALILPDAHKLIHAVQEEIIEKYLDKLQCFDIHFQRLNKMRKRLGFSGIDTNR